MKKFLVMVKHSWAGSFSLCEWFDFECDARLYIAERLRKDRGNAYRLLNIVVTDQEPEDVTPLANVAGADDKPDIHTDDAAAVADHLLPPLEKARS